MLGTFWALTFLLSPAMGKENMPPRIIPVARTGHLHSKIAAVLVMVEANEGSSQVIWPPENEQRNKRAIDACHEILYDKA